MVHNLINHLAAEGCTVAVVEAADGLLQSETAALLSSNSFRLRVHSALFTAYDAMGAVTGVEWLQAKGYRLLGLSGQMTASELTAREARLATGQSVFFMRDLEDGAAIDAVLRGRPEMTRA